ncbi:efflux RND transporter permease subunit [Klebsiella pneumoniae]|nr:efflux RND transporter permease subunit [Klebsiella pneumoniae]MCP5586372.1 efflux RND transporter permease subunit [Klebsiella pneumoniae]MCP5721463.1 efflux RND transporter permease subunit [Klebsiella pneumoniae]
MIEWIIRRSVANRFLVMMAALFLSIWGTWTIIHTPVDALPDLSDVQVIVKTRYPGQAPQIVENQVTWPLTTTMLSVPGAKTVRGFSQFGDSYVYVIFEDGTDPYWARSRVLEYLNQVQGKLPAGVSAEMGPDATGVGWVFEYALVDRSGKHDLAELRSLQDWFLKYELKTIPNVSEVASVGGVVKEYQIVVDPMKLTQYGISLGEVKSALDASNQEAGGSSVELAEAEYMVRASGYLQTLDDFKNIVLKTGDNGVPVYLGDVARVQIGPEMRRGIAELNGEGEVAGGVVILRSGKNAREVISAVKAKLASLQSSLPEGVEVVTTYDRSQLIDRAIDNLSYKLLEEFIVVALVCALFLWHVRSALVAIISLPLGLCFAFIMMHFQGLNANIMSLGGIAIAVGAMVGETVEGVERYPINIRYPQSYRDSPETLRQLPILTPLKQQIVLADVAEVKVVTGPSMLKTENARPTSWIYIDARDRDMVSVVHDLQQAIGKEVKLKPGISVSYSGQFELLERAIQKLKLMVPMTLMIIFVLLYLAFRRVGEALLIITSVPFALVGGIWFLYWMGFHLSVATGTGFIALAGVAAEFGVVMLMYLRHAIEAEPSLENPQTFSVDKLDEALYRGAVLRVRPKAMTVAVIIAGLLPILWGTGAGSEVMSRIAAPMIGGMITAPLLSLFIIPAAYKLMWLYRHRGKRSQ